MMQTWYLVFVMMMPNGNIDTMVLSEHRTMEKCYYEMDEYLYSVPDIEDMVYNWDFVCLEKDK